MSATIDLQRTDTDIHQNIVAVKQLPHQLAAAWDRGDAEAYAESLTEDADYILFDGSHSHGRAAIAEIHRPVFERFLKGSRLAVESVDARLLAEDVAVIHSAGGVLRRRDHRLAKSQRSVQTMVAVKTGDIWRIAAFQNTRYKPFSDTLVWKIAQMLPKGSAKTG